MLEENVSESNHIEEEGLLCKKSDNKLEKHVSFKNNVISQRSEPQSVVLSTRQSDRGNDYLVVIKVLCYIIYPLFMMIASSLRFSVISLLYLYFGLFSLTVSYKKNLVNIKTFFKITCILCGILFILQSIFQMTIGVCYVKYPHLVNQYLSANCYTEIILRIIGFQRVDYSNITNIFKIVSEPLVIFVNLFTYVAILLFLKKFKCTIEEHPLQTSPKRKKLNSIFSFVFAISIYFAGAILPSVASFIYFITFFTILSCWAMHIKFGEKFQLHYYKFIILYTLLYISLIYLYQIYEIQNFINLKPMFTKLMGLRAFIQVPNPNLPWITSASENITWKDILSPISLIVLYYIISAKYLVDSISRGIQTSYISITTFMDRLRNSLSVQPVNSSSSCSIDENTSCDHVDVKILSFYESLQFYLFRHNYVLTIIMMMVWSISYHSCMTFIYLLGACFVWMTQSRLVYMYSSPFIVIWALILILGQYIYNMDLSNMPKYLTKDISINDIGIATIPLENFITFDPFFHLCIKTIFAFIFSIGLKQSMMQIAQVSRPRVRQNINSRTDRFLSDSSPNSQFIHSDLTIFIGTYLWKLLAKYWIFMVCLMFLSISVQNCIVYRIIYLILFSLSAILFKISFRIWRRTITYYWWTVIIYSILVLIFIYLYQFKFIMEYTKSVTQMNNEQLADLGLKRYDLTELFVRLLTPTFFLIVIIIQLQYFQNVHLLITQTGEVDQTTFEAVNNAQKFRRLVKNMYNGNKNENGQRYVNLFLGIYDPCVYFYDKYISPLFWYFWRILDNYLYLAVLISAAFLILNQVTLVNFVILIFIVCMIPFLKAKSFIITIILILTCIALVLRQIFQLNLINDLILHNSLTLMFQCKSNFDKMMLSNAAFIHHKDHYDFGILGWLLYENDKKNLSSKAYIIIIIIVIISKIAQLYQKYIQSVEKIAEMDKSLIFPGVYVNHVDTSISNCIKYIVNFGFYRFGLELSIIFAIITSANHIDLFGILHIIMAGIFIFSERKACGRCFGIWIVVLIFLIIIQYGLGLGLPQNLCMKYPWDTLITNNFCSAKIFMGLPYVFIPPYKNTILRKPDIGVLIYDFILLLTVVHQHFVFYLEKCEAIKSRSGNNDCITIKIDRNEKISVPDFMIERHSHLDYVKIGVFYLFYWISILWVFISSQRQSILCLIYVLISFFFLSKGRLYFLVSHKKLMGMWTLVVAYTYFVLFFTSLYQFPICIFDQFPKWLSTLMDIPCYSSKYSTCNNVDMNLPEIDDNDVFNRSYDIICIILLLIQRRIFMSQYFRHVVDSMRITDELASYGAKIIDAKLIDEVRNQKHEEEKVMIKIRESTSRIREKFSIGRDLEYHYEVIRTGYSYFKLNDPKWNNHADDDEEDSDNVDTHSTGVMDRTEQFTTSVIHGIQQAVSHNTKPSQSNLKKFATKIINLNKVRSRTERSTGDIETLKPLKSTALSENISDVLDNNHIDSQLSTLYNSKNSAEISLKNIYDDNNLEYDIEDARVSHGSDVLDDAIVETGEQVLDNEPSVFNDISNIPYDDNVESKFVYDYYTPNINTHSNVVIDDQNEKFSCCSCLKRFFMHVKANLLIILNNLSRDYRTVYDRLQVEREKMKKLFNSNRITNVSVQEVVVNISNQEYSTCNEDVGLRNSHDSSDWFDVLIGFVITIISKSQNICYFCFILNATVYGTVISLFYPLSLFFWAAISIPRPSKFFWNTIIIYTEIILFAKYVSRSKILYQDITNEYTNKILKIIGLGEETSWKWDLLLLICVFIHRIYLMDFGLWKSATNKNYIKQIVDSPSNSSEKKKSKSSSNNLACWKVNKEDECQNENAHIAYIPEEGNVPIVPKVENETSSLKIGNEEKSDCARKSSIPSKIFAVRLSIVSSYKYWIHSEYALPRSYYVSMFFFEFICFLIIAFGYKSFQPKEDDFTDVKSIFTKNRIPWIFTFMLLTQFLFMIIDRIIYLKKSVQSKLVFHVIVVSIIHFWLFFYMEKITGQYFWHNSAAKMFYFFKCIYFYISCCQIRSKYPIRVIGHFLTKNYNYVTLYLYVIYRAIPFLTEIRNVMDWICTDTTLTISHWFILEDVHSLLFKTKCWRRYELEYCELRGIAKGKFTKWGQGLFFLLGMIIIIWLPLIIFSLPNNVYQPNPPIKCKIDIRIGEIQSIYTMESLSNDVINSRNINYNEIKSNKISKFRSSDITYMRMNPFSLSYCDVTPPMLKYLTDIFNSRNDTNINVIMHFYRKSGPILSDEIISNVFNTTLKYDSKERKLFQSMLQFISNSNSMSNSTIEPVTLINLIPNRLILPSKLNPIDLKLENKTFVLSVKKMNDSVWWSVNEEGKIDFNIIAYSERISIGILSIISSYGIIGLYLSLVLVISKFLRIILSGYSNRIMFEELPNVDKLLNLCNDIFTVREAKDFRLEEELFSKLMFIYRSPAHLIEWTKYQRLKTKTE